MVGVVRAITSHAEAQQILSKTEDSPRDESTCRPTSLQPSNFPTIAQDALQTSPPPGVLSISNTASSITPALIEIRASKGRGFGVFALRDILPGEIVLLESPLLVMTESGARADPLTAALLLLTPQQHSAYFSLSAYKSHQGEELMRSIMYSNGFGITLNSTAVFELGCRINHSCAPNTDHQWRSDEVAEAGEAGNVMVFQSISTIQAGDEVTIDYGHREKALLRIYGFDCDCKCCSGTEQSEVEDGIPDDEVAGSWNECTRLRSLITAYPKSSIYSR